MQRKANCTHVYNSLMMDTPDFLKEIATACGGKITEVNGALGVGFAVMSMPLPKTHWIYKGDRTDTYGTFNVPPMPFRMGSADEIVIRGEILTKRQFSDKIKAAGQYAVRAATMNGKEMDFDPDALIQNLLVGMLGYWTENGLSSDDWDNPTEAA